MKNPEWQTELLTLLASSATVVSVKDISRKLFISQPTARRYLTKLAEQGLIIRTHGGALINYNMTSNSNQPLYLRLSSMDKEKNDIAAQAAAFVHDDNVIFLDASSTCLHVLPYLKDFRNLTVCTNGLKTASATSEMGINTIFFGGPVTQVTMSCNGSETAEWIKNINADILFFSCDALSDEGELTDNSRESSFTRKQFMRNAKTRVLLIDSSKLRKRCWYNLCTLADVDYCFCNEPLPPALSSLLRK